MPQPVIAGILLAAGSSSRMGQPKLLLPLGDTTVVGWSLRNAEESNLDTIVVVTGAVRELGITPTRATVVHNPDYTSGSISSLLTGVDSLDGEFDAVMVLLGDSPEIDPPIIDMMADDWRRHQPWAALAQYHEGAGHPFVLSKQLIPEIRGFEGDKVLWRFLADTIASTDHQVRRVSIPQVKPEDIDTWQDYVEVHQAFGYGIPRP